jgi:hypothetical protein
MLRAVRCDPQLYCGLRARRPASARGRVSLEIVGPRDGAEDQDADEDADELQ